MTHNSRFLRPLSSNGSYRFNPNRTLPPRVLAASYFLKVLYGEVILEEPEKASYERCLHCLRHHYPVVQMGHMERKFIYRGPFIVDTIWSHTPYTPDIFVVTGPEDIGFFGIGSQYGQTGEEALFAKLTPIPLPYLQ